MRCIYALFSPSIKQPASSRKSGAHESLPPYAAGQPAALVDARLREALAACDQARQCAVLWFAEVRRRCATPGCGSARFLEVHHVVPRSAGGANDVANLVTLCSRCHGFVHEHRLRAPAHAGAGGELTAPADSTAGPTGEMGHEAGRAMGA